MDYIYTTKPDLTKIAGGVEIKEDIRLVGKDNFVARDIKVTDTTTAKTITGLLTDEEVQNIIDIYYKSNDFSPVTVQGMQLDEGVNEGAEIGSMRITGYYPKLAMQLNKLLSPVFAEMYWYTKICDSTTSTDFWQDNLGNKWEYYGVSPMLRFMKYEEHGKHHPHYDAGFIYDNPKYRTLQSFVLYLTTNDSGSTRFVEDNQSHKNIWDRDHSDWNRMANQNEVQYESLPEKGKFLIFDHRMCHDVSEFMGNEPNRIIIRGDIVYKLK